MSSSPERAKEGARGRRRVGIVSLRGTDQVVNAAAYFMRSALERWVGETTHLGERYRLTGLGGRLARWSGRVSEEVYLQRAERQLRRAPQDLLFGLYAGSTLAMFEATTAPVVYVTDGAAHDLVHTYPQFATLSPARIAEILRLEEEGIARAAMVVTHTQWSARSLIEKAGADPEKVVIIPPGVAPEKVDASLQPKPLRPGERLEALFVGRAWERKGLREAVAAVELLNVRGVPAHLTVLGCQPPPSVLSESATCVGAFDPNDVAELARYEEHLRDAHVHLLPSKAECFGMAIAEAAAQGTPSIVTDVQGLPEAVLHDQTGAIISGDGDVAGALAEVMSGWYEDPEAHQRLCQGALRDVAERLNWDAWGSSVASSLEARSL